METWKKIDGFDAYEVSDWGGVRRGKRVLKGCKLRDGYRSVVISNDTVERKHYLIHNLVGLTFLPNPENMPSIKHIDKDRTNNRIDNLEWATQSHTPKPVGNTNHRHITQIKRSGSYKVQISRGGKRVFEKVFRTLPDAIKARDEFMCV